MLRYVPAKQLVLMSRETAIEEQIRRCEPSVEEVRDLVPVIFELADQLDNGELTITP